MAFPYSYVKFRVDPPFVSHTSSLHVPGDQSDHSSTESAQHKLVRERRAAIHHGIPWGIFFLNLHDWVILEGKCWDSYSSTMEDEFNEFKGIPSDLRKWTCRPFPFEMRDQEISNSRPISVSHMGGLEWIKIAIADSRICAEGMLW